jgi:threonine/homoserine/homoserine lactone efflux protein
LNSTPCRERLARNPYTAAGRWQPGELRACARFTGGLAAVLHTSAIDILNPKLSIFFLAFPPQFVVALAFAER